MEREPSPLGARVPSPRWRPFAVGVLIGGLALAACSGSGGSGSNPGVASPHFVYVANEQANDLSAYTLNAQSGVLVPIDCGGGSGCQGNGFATGGGPAAIAVDPNNQFVYVANQGDNDLSVYRISPGGTLTAVACGGGSGCTGNNFTAGGGPQAVAVHPSSQFLYVANGGDNDLSVYRIGPGGTLIPLACGGGSGCTGNNFTAETNPQALAVGPSGVFLYVVNNGSNTVSVYNINVATGVLTEVGTPAPTGSGPDALALDPTGHFAYVTNGTSGDVSAYGIDATAGTLTPIACEGSNCNGSNFTADSSPEALALDSTGKFLYVVNNTGGQSGGDVSAYRLNTATGALTLINCGAGLNCTGPYFSAGTAPTAIAVDSGGFVYVTNTSNFGSIAANDISAYLINVPSGVLTPIGCNGGIACNGSDFIAGTFPAAIAIAR